MSDLVLTLLRLSYLVLLWVLVLACVGVLRRDIFGTRIFQRGKRNRGRPTDRGGDQGGSGQPSPGRSAPVTLVVREGPLTGTQLSLTSSAVLIGRAPSCSLVIDDDVTSGRHARIFPHDGGWYLEDLGSTNGTWLGEQRVGDPVPVGLGVPIRVGRTTMELRRQR